MDESIRVEAGLLHDNVCQALVDPKRIVILYLLADGPHNVTDIARVLGSPQSTVSRHLKVLRERGLVNTERDGPQVVYSLADRRVIEALDLMRAMVTDALRAQGRLAESLDSASPCRADQPDRARAAPVAPASAVPGT